MEAYSKPVEIRWSDLDPNFHLRHSVYYDWGAYVRVCLLSENGFTTQVLLQNNLGPILFREECVFKREVVFGDEIIVNVQLVRSRRDASRWSMRHEVIKNRETIAAVINVDGAWIDTKLRKLAVPPASVVNFYEIFPKAPDFAWD